MTCMFALNSSGTPGKNMSKQFYFAHFHELKGELSFFLEDINRISCSIEVFTIEEACCQIVLVSPQYLDTFIQLKLQRIEPSTYPISSSPENSQFSNISIRLLLYEIKRLTSYANPNLRDLIRSPKFTGTTHVQECFSILWM